MPHRLKVISVLFAWLLATGSQWDLVQTFAWGRMISAYAESMPLLEAVKKTFTAENMCGVCDLVDSAKSDLDGLGIGQGPGNDKLLFAVAPRALLVVALTVQGDARAQPRYGLSASRPPPPVPPPRLAVA